MPLYCLFHWPLRHTDLVFMVQWLFRHDIARFCLSYKLGLCVWSKHHRQTYRKYQIFPTVTENKFKCKQQNQPYFIDLRIGVHHAKKEENTLPIKLHVGCKCNLRGDKRRCCTFSFFIVVTLCLSVCVCMCATETPTFIITHFEREVHWTVLCTAWFLLTMYLIH